MTPDPRQPTRFDISVQPQAAKSRESLRRQGILPPWAFTTRERELFTHLSGPMGRLSA